MVHSFCAVSSGPLFPYVVLSGPFWTLLGKLYPKSCSVTPKSRSARRYPGFCRLGGLSQGWRRFCRGWCDGDSARVWWLWWERPIQPMEWGRCGFGSGGGQDSSWMPVLYFLIYLKILFYFLTLQYCIGFAIYQNVSTTGIHVLYLDFSNFFASNCSLRPPHLSFSVTPSITSSPSSPSFSSSCSHHRSKNGTTAIFGLTALCRTLRWLLSEYSKSF